MISDCLMTAADLSEMVTSFWHLPDAVDALEKIGRNKTIRARDIIFHQGDDAIQYFGITSGIIKLVKHWLMGTRASWVFLTCRALWAIATASIIPIQLKR